MSFALADLAALVTGAGLIKNLISPNQNQPPPLAGQGGLGGQGTTSGWPTPQPSQNPPPQVPGTRDQPPPVSPPGTRDQVASNAPVPVPPSTPNAITPAGGNVPVPRGGTPSWMTLPPAQLYSTDFGPVERVIMGPESGGQNIRQLVKNPTTGKMEPTGPASGYIQIEDDTWRYYAPQAGVDLNRWPTAMSAPPMVQQAVGQIMPVSRWAKGTYAAVKAAFPWITPDMTLGQIDQIATRAGPQRYIQAQADRGPGEWGRTPPGGYPPGPGNMPTSMSDFGNIMQKAMLMAPLLSLFTRAPSTAMLASYGAFVNGYQHGQLLQQQLSKGQWQENLKETRARLETEAMEAGDAFNAYGNDEAGLTSMLGQIAAKYGDDPLRAALANGGSVAAHKLLQGRDAYFTDLNKAQLAQQKMLLDEQKFMLDTQIKTTQLQLSTARNDIERKKLQVELGNLREKRRAADASGAALGLPPSGGGDDGGDSGGDDGGGEAGGGGGGGPAPAAPAQTPAATPAPAPSRTATTSPPPDAPQKPVQAPAASPPANAPATPAPAQAPPSDGGGAPSEPAPPSQPAETTPAPDQAPPETPDPAVGAPDPSPSIVAGIPNWQRLTPQQQSVVARIGEQIAQGQNPELKGVPPDLQTAAQVYASQVQNEINRLNSSNLSGPALIKQMAQIDPYRARLVQAMIDGRYPEPEGFSARSPYWQGVIGLANKIDPTLDANTFKTRAATFRSFTSGTDGRNLTAIGTAYRHMNEMERAVQDRISLGSSWLNAPFNAGARIAGVGRQARALEEFGVTREALADELSRAFRGTGGAQANIEYWKGVFDPNKSAAQLNAALTEARRLLRGRLEELGARFVAGSGRPISDMPKLFQRYSGDGGVAGRLVEGMNYGSDVGGYTVGKSYTDAKGNRATWLGLYPDKPSDPRNWRTGP